MSHTRPYPQGPLAPAQPTVYAGPLSSALCANHHYQIRLRHRNLTPYTHHLPANPHATQLLFIGFRNPDVLPDPLRNRPPAL